MTMTEGTEKQNRKWIIFRVHWNSRDVLHATTWTVSSTGSFVYIMGSKKLSHLLKRNNSFEKCIPKWLGFPVLYSD
jgi:hypothetical protein